MIGEGEGMGLGRVGAKEELSAGEKRRKKKETHNTIIRRTD